MFGRNLDAHTPHQDSNTIARIQHVIPAFSKPIFQNMSEGQCLIGRECYISSFRVTLMVSVVSLMLSVVAVIRDGRRNQTGVRRNQRVRG